MSFLIKYSVQTFIGLLADKFLPKCCHLLIVFDQLVIYIVYSFGLDLINMYIELDLKACNTSII